MLVLTTKKDFCHVEDPAFAGLPDVAAVHILLRRKRTRRRDTAIADLSAKVVSISYRARRLVPRLFLERDRSARIYIPNPPIQ